MGGKRWQFPTSPDSNRQRYECVMTTEAGDIEAIVEIMNMYGKSGWDIFQVNLMKQEGITESALLYMKRERSKDDESTRWIRQHYLYNIVTESGTDQDIPGIMNMYGKQGWSIFQVEPLKSAGITGAVRLYMKREK